MTTTRLPTFSGLPRWFRCELTDVLPKIDEPSEDARIGTARHTFFERIAQLMQDPAAIRIENVKDPESGKDLGEQIRQASRDEARELALAEAPPEHQEVLACIPLERVQLDNVAGEVAFAFDLETGKGREIGRGLAREYGEVAPSEVVGTIDRVSLVGNHGLYVGDYKGRSHRRHPAEDEQFLAAALAAARAYGRSWVDLEAIRVMGDEVFLEPAYRLTVADLDRFELRLQDRADLARKNREALAKDPADLPPGEVGPHCSYCPHLRFCPAQMAIARAVIGGDSDELQGVAKVGAQYLDEVSAPRIHALLAPAEALLEKVKAAIRNYARQTPFQLTDGTGRWYGVPPDATERELGEGNLVYEVLDELFGEDAAKKGVKVEGTFGGIEAAVKAYLAVRPAEARKGAIKELREKAEAELAKRGLLRTLVGGQVKVHKRKE